MSYLTKILAGSAAVVLLCVNQPVRGEDPAHLTVQDRKFMMDAAKGGMMEVQMGHMGLEHGSSMAVKDLSQRLIDDHTKGKNELMDLAKQKGMTLPPDDASNMPKALTGKSGADFDREFAKAAIADHQKDIAAFVEEAKLGSDPDVKEWATKTLPTLRAHLAAAQALPVSTSK